MKRLIAVIAAVGAVLAFAVLPASSARIDDTNGGPVCADITNDSNVWAYDASTGTLTFRVATVAPSCRGITYTVYVYDDVTHALIGSGSATGTKGVNFFGQGILDVTVRNVYSSTDGVCIAATSSGDRVFDRAPDLPVLCVSFSLVDTSGGQQTFN